MFPHEAQAIMAKILFFVFALAIICMRPVSSAELDSAFSAQNTTITVVKSINP